MTPSGIDPATFRFEAQCLNHCATACPLLTMSSGDRAKTEVLKLVWPLAMDPVVCDIVDVLITCLTRRICCTLFGYRPSDEMLVEDKIFVLQGNTQLRVTKIVYG
jgi:hypothetical protein